MPLHSALPTPNSAFLIAVAGIPGSGKTTFCEGLKSRIPGLVVLPMDGYHLPRNQLDAEGLRRRGARHTFDAEGLRADLIRLKQTRTGLFPAFDHAEQDPRPDAIAVTSETPLVMVEGLYLLMRDWRMEELFDWRIFLDCELELALERLTARHLACGLAKTEAEARHRAGTNDRLNALDILSDGCRERADALLKNRFGLIN